MREPLWTCVDETPRVWISRIREDVVTRAAVLDLAVPQDENRSAELLHDRQIMRDKQHRKVLALNGLPEQFDDLGLHRDIKCRGRLVSDDNSRTSQKSPCNADALFLPAGELMRIPGQQAQRKPKPFHHGVE